MLERDSNSVYRQYIQTTHDKNAVLHKSIPGGIHLQKINITSVDVTRQTLKNEFRQLAQPIDGHTLINAQIYVLLIYWPCSII